MGRIAICGYVVQMCCDTTARQAYHLGFQVDFFSDAIGTLAREQIPRADDAGSLPHVCELPGARLAGGRVIAPAGEGEPGGNGAEQDGKGDGWQE